MSSLAERLKECREELGWKKSELRRRAGLRSASTLTSLEKGETVESPQLGAIADALGVEVMWLQHGKGPKQKGSPNPATQFSENALHVAKLIDSLPKELSAKVVHYAGVVKSMHDLDVLAGNATDATPLEPPAPLADE